MRIVIANHEFRAHFPARIKYLHDYLTSLGHELYVIELYGISICYQFSDDHDFSDDYWEILFPGQKAGMVSSRKVNKLLVERLDEINPDVVVAGIPTFPVGIVSLRWAKSHKKAIVHFGDAKKETFKHSRLVHEIKRMLFRNAEAFIAPAPSWEDSMTFWGFNKDEIFYGLDVANNKEWEGELVNTQFKYLPSEYIVNCCRQVSMKNLPFLLEAYKQYVNEGGSLPLLMVGEGIMHEELVAAVNGNRNIVFLPFLTHSQMREVFSQMKALVVPSFKEETWGITVNEAMAASRIAAVSTEVGCASTLIEDGINGYVFSPHNQQELVDVFHKIESLDSSRLEVMRRNAYNKIQEWNVDRFAEETLNACQYAVSHKKKIHNIFDYILIKLWRGRMTIKNE